jgi:hypothetical protein
MNRAIALLLLAAMSANCAARGPAASRTSIVDAAVPAPQPNSTPELWRKYAQQLPVGTNVRVSTGSTGRFTGTLLAVGDEAITVSPRTRVPEPPREIRFDAIRQLEITKRNGTNVAQAVVIGAGVGAGVFLGLLFMAFAVWGD